MRPVNAIRAVVACDSLRGGNTPKPPLPSTKLPIVYILVIRNSGSHSTAFWGFREIPAADKAPHVALSSRMSSARAIRTICMTHWRGPRQGCSYCSAHYCVSKVLAFGLLLFFACRAEKYKALVVLSFFLSNHSKAKGFPHHLLTRRPFNEHLLFTLPEVSPNGQVSLHLVFLRS